MGVDILVAIVIGIVASLGAIVLTSFQAIRARTKKKHQIVLEAPVVPTVTEEAAHKAHPPKVETGGEGETLMQVRFEERLKQLEDLIAPIKEMPTMGSQEYTLLLFRINDIREELRSSQAAFERRMEDRLQSLISSMHRWEFIMAVLFTIAIGAIFFVLAKTL